MSTYIRIFYYNNMKEDGRCTNFYVGFHLMTAAYETLEIKLCYVAKE